MEVFLAEARAAADSGSPRPVDLTPFDAALRATTATAEVTELLYSLVDAYGTSDRPAYRLAVLEATGSALRCLVARKEAAALAADDRLMLCMFFSELSTVTHPALFLAFARALAALYALAAPAAYATAVVPPGGGEDTEASIRAEVSALRQVMGKRLAGPPTTGTVAASGAATGGMSWGQAQARAALDCLGGMAKMQLALLKSSASLSPAVVVEELGQELQAALDNLMGPIVALLEEQQRQQQQAASVLSRELHSLSGIGSGSSGGTPTITASLVASVMTCLEEALWATEHARSATTATATSAAAAAAVYRHTVGSLLRHLQHYLALQQHRQNEAAAGSAGLHGGGGGGGGGPSSRAEAAADILRTYSVQRAIQRMLSTALAAAKPGTATAAAPTTGKDSEEGRLLSVTLSSGLQAALAAFGGPVAVQPPESLPTLLPPSVAVTAAAEGWAAVCDRARECASVLAGSSSSGDAALALGGDAYGADGELIADDDMYGEEGGGGGATGGGGLVFGAAGREPLLKSSAGPATASALLDMVVLSIGSLDRAMVGVANLRAVHLQGLDEMVYTAGRHAQREELERQRLIELQGVEAIPAVKLLDQVRDSAQIQARGLATMRRATARAVLERAAFSSILRSYAHVKDESEATVRAAQALISRCLVQLPPSMADAALDEVLVGLDAEFHREFKIRAAAAAAASTNRSGANSGHSAVLQTHSYFQLVLQVLFSYAAAQAPIQERGEFSPLLFLADGTTTGAAASAASTGGGGGGANSFMASKAAFTVDTENPIAFLQEESTRVASYEPSAAAAGGGGDGRRGRKRQRNDNDSSANEDDGMDDEDGGTGGGGDTTFFFNNDTARTPCAYSHVLCRVMELADANRLDALLLDIVLQAPVLTRYVWGHIYRRFCLSSTSKERCLMGFHLLLGLATHRPVYRGCAVNLLLRLTMSRGNYARRVAVVFVGKLLSSQDGNGGPLVPPDAEAALVRYAKKQLAAIPGYQFTTIIRATREAGATALDADAIAALQATEDRKAQEVLSRHLGLFLMLCARQPRGLFASLLDVYKQCVERNSEVVVRLLPAARDVQELVQQLLESDPAGFMVSVVPFLRRYSADATLFVQTLLGVISAHLRKMGRQQQQQQQGGAGAAAVAAGILEHAKAMYELSKVPLGAAGAPTTHHHHGGVGLDDDDEDDDGTAHFGSGGFVLHDVRFLAPFLSLIPAAELKQRYLPAFLYFVQVQLRLQRDFKQQSVASAGGEAVTSYRGATAETMATMLLSARERVYVLTNEELKQFAALVIREVLLKSPFRFDDGLPRGLAPVDFLVFVHRAPDESLAAAAAAAAAAATAQATDGTPPIGIATTKAVVAVCFELTREFRFEVALATTPRLYGPDEVQRAIKRMMTTPPPVPSQVMSTVLQALGAMYPRGTRYAAIRELLQFVVGSVLTPLERAGAWADSPQLWKGVLLFADSFYSECSGFMVNLPDQVLIQALREHPRLAEKFREEHGNNASFGHILGNI